MGYLYSGNERSIWVIIGLVIYGNYVVKVIIGHYR